MEEDAQEQWLRDRQDGRVYPVGRALRETFDAENHDTLGSDVTGLMIDLSRVPDAPCANPPARPAIQSDASTARSLFARMSGLFSSRPRLRTR